MAEQMVQNAPQGQQGHFHKFRVNLPRKPDPPLEIRQAHQTHRPPTPTPQAQQILMPRSPTERSPHSTSPINYVKPPSPHDPGAETQSSTPTIPPAEPYSSKPPHHRQSNTTPQNPSAPRADTQRSNPPKSPNPQFGALPSTDPNPSNHRLDNNNQRRKPAGLRAPWPPQQIPFAHHQYPGPPNYPGSPHYSGPPPNYLPPQPGPPSYPGMLQHSGPSYYPQQPFHPQSSHPTYHNFIPNQTMIPPSDRALSVATESKTQSMTQGGRTRGKQLTRKEDAVLVKVCNKNRKAYGRKDLQTEFWNLIVDQFQALVRRPYPYKSVQRRMKVLMEARKQEIADHKTGDERREDEWTNAIDKWIKHVDMHDLEQQSSRKRSLGEYLEESSVDDEMSNDGGEFESDLDCDQSTQIPDEPSNPEDPPMSNGNLPRHGATPPVDLDKAPPESPGRSTPGTTPGFSTRASSANPIESHKRALSERKAAAKQKKREDLLREALNTNPRKRKRSSETRGSVFDRALSSIAESFKSYVDHLISNSSVPTSSPGPIWAVNTATTNEFSDRLRRIEELLSALTESPAAAAEEKGSKHGG